MLLVALSLSGCGGGALSLLTGGGPNVAANTQAGQTNQQTLGVSESTQQTVTKSTVRTVEQSSGDTRVRSERVERVVVNELDWRLMLLFGLFAGFVIPSPAEIGKGLARMVGFGRNKA